ncbi:hypothetical protein NDN08_006056 [Rhodosorus marinus]|uniref:EamA domain-containing protein n=1 Tax=Rhodosorus marinus TaxID=101924 RepID=A0AAV8UJQ6_9RHOD|nr:hypothetical protein NDN08_006056 [Rhodosorus marinus]
MLLLVLTVTACGMECVSAAVVPAAPPPAEKVFAVVETIDYGSGEETQGLGGFQGNVSRGSENYESSSSTLPRAEKDLSISVLGALQVPSWSIGLLLGLFGYSLAGLGMNLIRLSHLVGGSRNAAALDKLKETRFNKKSTKNRSSALWSIGYGVNAMGGSINSLGLRFTAQSLMAPLSSVALVSNAVFATCLNGETLRIRRDLGSIFLIFVGNCVTVSTGNHEGFQKLAIEEVFQLWTRKPFVLYLILTTAMVVTLAYLYQKTKRTMEIEGGRERAPAGVLVRLGLCHASGAVMLGVNSVLIAKSLMLVLSGGFSNFLRPSFMLLTFLWATVTGFWLYTLNKLLREYDALFIVPVIEVTWSLMSMISGGIFFDEYSSMHGSRLVIFFVGVSFNVTGIWLIGHGRESKGEKSNV